MTTTFQNIKKAHERISPFVHRTPIHSSRIINEMVGGQLFFKCENFQKGGAFNAIHSLDEVTVKRGVVTHSSGNHAAAVALGANSRNTTAHVVMPSNASAVKKAAVKGYGANVIECAPVLADRESTAKRIIEETGATFLHPYNDERVIAGQGTAALEMIEDLAEAGEKLDIVMCPVGGGGLLAGTALVTRSLLPTAKIVAAEPKGADDAKRSFDAGVLIPQTAPDTIADGLLTSVGEINFPIIMENVDDILTVSEESIIGAMRLMWQHMKVIVEPSGAVPLAAILEHELDLKNRKMGIILSGGNVDIDRLPW